MVVQERKALPPSLHGKTSGDIVRKEFIIDIETPLDQVELEVWHLRDDAEIYYYYQPTL